MATPTPEEFRERLEWMETRREERIALRQLYMDGKFPPGHTVNGHWQDDTVDEVDKLDAEIVDWNRQIEEYARIWGPKSYA